MKKTLSIFVAAMLLLAAVPSFAQVQIGAGYVSSSDRVRVSNSTEVDLTNRSVSSVAGGIIAVAGEREEHYVNVPIHFNYGANFTPKFRFFFFGGPAVSYGVISRTTVSGSILGFSANTVVDNYRDVSGYGRWDVMVGGGMGFDLVNRLRLTVGYDFGLMNRYIDGGDYDRHRQQLHAGLAFLF